MAINLPNELLQKEAFKTLPAKEKEEYLSNLLNKVLQLNPDGVTISQIKEATGLTYSTIWHHLEILKSSTQCRKISRGNIDVYYTFGKPDEFCTINKEKVKYTIATVENGDGKFVCTHEKRETSLGTPKVLRGIAIPIELLDEFINCLIKIKSRYSDIKQFSKIKKANPSAKQ